MKNWSFLLLITIFFACNESGKKPDGSADGAAGDNFTPATPGGKVAVSFPTGDTGRVTIAFEMNGQSKEKTFDLPLADDAKAADLYRTVWDKPNSCYIGVLMKKRNTRYYHASVDGSDLKINQVGTPPAAVWQYAEQKEGLGKLDLTTTVTKNYRRNITSGNIIADFIVKIQPAITTTDSVYVYAEFGGANKTLRLPVPDGYSGGIISAKEHPENCTVIFAKGSIIKNIADVSVKDGHLQITNM
ncbi:hypothetical protein SAMN05518672_104541 [Chitinophaga sp. CF118]|uniref:hypothetical protein n=1 Tax=Chitinophaga sp. CF118 TaxID=1884367 RepID=UPI0008E863BE|nr:hypothetical protein [Chitinophaga sp. CF118]SFE11515.1 hypothetical protein SAMN05518672_104541 [Chitinophaga sp. CF118]